MKIISNFKDYYDFQQGTIGIDDKVVYERINKDYRSPVEATPIFKKLVASTYRKAFAVESYELAICGVKHFVYIYEGQVYLNEAYKKIPKEHRKDLSVNDRYFEGSEVNFYRNTDLNEKHDCPVILIKNYNWDNQIIWKNPRLADFNFGRVMDPYTIWVQIYNFLLREPIITNNQTDIEKLEAHGFDKKTSFRKC